MLVLYIVRSRKRHDAREYRIGWLKSVSGNIGVVRDIVSKEEEYVYMDECKELMRREKERELENGGGVDIFKSLA